MKSKIPADIGLIEKVIKTKYVRGIKHILVKYRGYPDKFNQWIPAKNVFD